MAVIAVARGAPLRLLLNLVIQTGIPINMFSNWKIRFVIGILLLLLLPSCGDNLPFVETFDAPGDWRVGNDADVTGEIRDGAYHFSLNADDLIKWTNAGKSFSDGIYTVEAMQTAGPLDNAYGMLLRVDDEKDNFYLFAVSGDGYVWIGRYLDGGKEEATPIIGSGWVESAAVNQGLDATNELQVRAESGNMIFLVNQFEIGRVTDNTFQKGDIGLMVRTLGVGGVEVQFDNFSVRPLD